MSSIIRILFYIGLFFVILSCNADIDPIKKRSSKSKTSVLKQKRVYPDSLDQIYFSGFKWVMIKETRKYLLSDYCDSDPKNAFVDKSNVLHLLLSEKNDKKSGIILEIDTTLGFGVFSFDIITDLYEMDPDAYFTFSLINVDKKKSEKISEIGMRFTNPENESGEVPLQYFIYTTAEKVPYEFYYEKKYPELSLTKHLIEIDSQFIRLSSFEGFLDYQSSEFFEYIFDFSENDIEIEVPTKVRIRLSFCHKNDIPETISNDSANIEIIGIDFVDSDKYYSRY